MKLKNLDSRLIKLPTSIEFTLLLIKEELKSSKLLNGLSKVGFDDSHYHTDFSAMILKMTGFDERQDDLYDFYFKLLDDYSKKLEEDHGKIVKHAFNLYVDLVIEKRRRSAMKQR